MNRSAITAQQNDDVVNCGKLLQHQSTCLNLGFTNPSAHTLRRPVGASTHLTAANVQSAPNANKRIRSRTPRTVVSVPSVSRPSALTQQQTLQ